MLKICRFEHFLICTFFLTFSLRDMVKLKQKQRAREVISQSSNADIRYALHTTFTHNLPGDEDLGEVPRGMGLETQCLDHSARQQNETDLQGFFAKMSRKWLKMAENDLFDP